MLLGLGAGVDQVAVDVPVPYDVARAGERECAALDVADDALGADAGESVLHDREPDQHHDQLETAQERGRDKVVGEHPRDREARRQHPDREQEPGRDQQHRAVVVMCCEINHKAEPDDGHGQKRKPRDAGRDPRIEKRDGDQQREEGEPARREVRITHVPAAEIEIGEQKHDQRRGEDRFARRAPELLGAWGEREYLVPESKIDADIAEHRPGERGGGGEHD